MLTLALVTGFGAFILAMYGQADDAPGAVLLALGVLMGAVTLATMALQRTRRGAEAE
jgi:hypothetical protein